MILPAEVAPASVDPFVLKDEVRPVWLSRFVVEGMGPSEVLPFMSHHQKLGLLPIGKVQSYFYIRKI